MKIVIDFRITYNNDAALSVFTQAFWLEMVRGQPDHFFIFLTDRSTVPMEQPVNLTWRFLKKSTLQWLHRKRLEKALVANNADRLITIHPAGFYIRHLQHGKKYLLDDVAADQWISFASGTDLLPPAEKQVSIPVISIVQAAMPAVVTSLSWTEAESIKTQYTGGRSFFLFTGAIGEQHQLLELLKAFSLFKKWQQSNMQLVIAGCSTRWTQSFVEKLDTYKYKADVLVLKNPDDAAISRLVAAAYALLYPVTGHVFPFALLWPAAAGKAVIASDNAINRQVNPVAEWVAENDTAAGFARAMILLYKDEKHLQWLLQQAGAAGTVPDREQMLAAVWARVEK